MLDFAFMVICRLKSVLHCMHARLIGCWCLASFFCFLFLFNVFFVFMLVWLAVSHDVKFFVVSIFLLFYLFSFWLAVVYNVQVSCPFSHFLLYYVLTPGHYPNIWFQRKFHSAYQSYCRNLYWRKTASCIGEWYGFDVKDNCKEYYLVLCYKENLIDVF